MTRLSDKSLSFSIVIAAWNGPSLLRECLSSLKNQAIESGAEVIVVCNFDDEIENIIEFFSFAKYIILSSETTVPKLFTKGILESRGEIVALNEDICTFDSYWCREIVTGHSLNFSIVGGAVENHRGGGALNWAVYFFDYGKYMLPNRIQIVDALSTMNISYKRELLDDLKANYTDGFFGNFINDELVTRGYKLLLNPEALVFHNKYYQFQKIYKQIYYQARYFAAQRSAKFTILKRFIFALLSPLLPFILLKRFVFRINEKKRLYKEFLLAFPYLIVLVCIWSLGECFGYVNGAKSADKEWR